MKLKLLFIILSWFLFVNSSQKTEWYVELYSTDNVIVKVSRDQYLEYKSMLTGHNGKFENAYIRAKTNEYECWEQTYKPNEDLINEITWN